MSSFKSRDNRLHVRARRSLKKFFSPRFESRKYWEDRYLQGGNSGAGSYGRLGQFKANVLNAFVSEWNIRSVIEWGCGDGHQLSLADYPEYLGIDISEKAVEILRKKFDKGSRKKFLLTRDFGDLTAELTLSLDVLFHLVEEEVYQGYMSKLFSSAERFVIIYSSNHEARFRKSRHVKHRKFTNWVHENTQDFSLFRTVENQFPYDPNDIENTSFSDFYVFKREA